MSRKGFVTYELPLVLALLGLVAGAFLWIWNGRMTTGAWIAFALAIPFAMQIGFVILDPVISRRTPKDDAP
jgi:prepilin signal peptidase PulO-like enzyme (type II secretory pathway)